MRACVRWTKRPASLRALAAACLASLLGLAGCGGDEAAVATTAPAAAAVAATPRPEGAGDYHDPGIQAKATALAAEVAKAPTTPATLKQRAATLWVWANAAAMDGTPLDPDLPATIARIVALPAPVPANAPGVAEAGRRVDEWVRQLAFRKANPKGLGRLTSPNTGPFTVDGFETLELVYTVGDAPMEVGGGFIVDVSAYGQPLKFQTDDPAAEGYVTVISPSPELKLAVAPVPVHALGATAPVPRPFFRITEGRLRPGDTVSIRVGEKAAGGPGLHLPSVSTSALRFKVWTRLDAKSPTFPLREMAFVTEGQATAGVRGIAPSVVAVGENVRIAIRSEDAFRNRATADFKPWVVTANGAEIGRVNNTNVAVNVVNTVFQQPGVYQVAIASADGKLRGEANPILVEAAPTRRVLWGDVDGHSWAALGSATADAWYAFARDDARLDFAAITDGDAWLDDAEWEAARGAAGKHRRAGEFETFLGHGWIGEPGAGGARIVLFRTPESRRRADRQRAPAAAQLFALLAAEHAPKDVLLISQGHRPQDPASSDPRFEHLVQVASARGSFEWLARRGQQAGRQLGVAGGGSDPFGHPGLRALLAGAAGEDAPGGLTAVLAPKRDRDAIFDALKQGSAYATNGARILLDVAVNGTAMGQRGAPAPRRQLAGRAIGTAPIERIVVLRNGQEVQVQDFARVASAGAASAIEVRFASDSDPRAANAFARGFRSWKGTLRVDGAKLADARASNTDNWYTERVGVSSANPQVVEFELRTRGNERSILLTFDGSASGARISLDVRSQVPDGTVVDAGGTPQADAFTQVFAAASLGGGEQVLRRVLGAHADTVTVRLVAPPTERDRAFTYTDAEGGDGDAYSVRVHTTDGGVAWSSPVWIGGRAGQPLRVPAAAAPPAAAATPAAAVTPAVSVAMVPR